jgi:glucose uptake protein GlcU
LSFAIGAAVANIVLIGAYALLARHYWDCALPSPQFRVMALPGLVSGTLWSMGNFLSLYAVSTLGQGMGQSFVQTGVIVSWLWGIFYYRENQGAFIMDDFMS